MVLRFNISIVVCLFAASAPARLGGQAADPRLAESIDWYTGVAGRVDDARAAELLLEAVADRDPLSIMWLARVHSTGRMGFPEDRERATALAGDVLPDVRALAAVGEVEAVFLMGTAYAEGLGVEPDPVQAATWYRLAAQRGHVLAQHNMGNVYFSGEGVEQSDERAIEWWLRAARQGDAIPALRVGRMYEEGRGVEIDLDEARRWYAESASRGNQAAAEALERLGR